MIVEKDIICTILDMKTKYVIKTKRVYIWLESDILIDKIFSDGM